MVLAVEPELAKAASLIARRGTNTFHSNSAMELMAKTAAKTLIPPDSDSSFRVTEKCTGCALCAKVCPAHNVEMAGGKPVWMHHCERCTSCMQICPAEAIEFGTSSESWGRYINPDISVRELIVSDND